jgi:hypothetical protein
MIIVEDVAVYHDGGGTSEYHFNMLKQIRFDGHRHYYSADSLDQFIKRAYKIRFAGFHVPFPAETSWLKRLDQIYDCTDRIFVFCSELHESTVNQLNQLDRPKITIFVNGVLQRNFYAARVYPWMDWFVQTLYFYKELSPGFLDQRLIHGTKSKKFDILLGAQRTHRDFVHNWINFNNLNDKVLMTYYHKITQCLDNNPDFFMETDGVEILPNSKLTHSIDRIKYFGHVLGLSQVIPIEIYNKTNYSIVAETNFDNSFNFYTEKIVKPIMAGRLFVVISGQHYLANLRKFGFQTFDTVIDESYDNEPDSHTRWSKAMEQVHWLCNQDSSLILDKINHIVEHNKKIMFTTEWYDNFSKTLDNEIRPYLENLNLREV